MINIILIEQKDFFTWQKKKLFKKMCKMFVY